jgi:protein CWC15
MTTAHRPTFDPARGGTGKGENDLTKLSTQFSARDLPSHKTLKYRERGQAHPDDVREKNLRYELEEKEREARERKRERDGITGAIEGTSIPQKKQKTETSFDADADEPAEDETLGDTDDDDDDDSDDDTELMAELERIKKEHAAEKARKEEEAREEQERIRHEAMIRGNPLLNLNDEQAADFKVKRRWDDDVVFKNCAKGIAERKKEATFINDSIRSEFHRKFMDKYIK